MDIDYRRINAIMKGSLQPLPRVEDIFYGMSECRYLTKLDFNEGFNQIKNVEENCKIAGFVTEEFWN